MSSALSKGKQQAQAIADAGGVIVMYQDISDESASGHL